MLAVKVMKEVAEADMVDREMEALAAVQGLPHFIQQLDSKYHRHADDSGPALIVTRYAHHLKHLPQHCYFQRFDPGSASLMCNQVPVQAAWLISVLTDPGPPPTSCPSLHASVIRTSQGPPSTSSSGVYYNAGCCTVQSQARSAYHMLDMPVPQYFTPTQTHCMHHTWNAVVTGLPMAGW